MHKIEPGVHQPAQESYYPAHPLESCSAPVLAAVSNIFDQFCLLCSDIDKKLIANKQVKGVDPAVIRRITSSSYPNRW